ncbi:MAG: ribosome maturation factor RimP [candidate division WOR-3 bacterium]|nr:ribosome maturation factor RimP [candidate division WOR-3 bacterium]
MPAVSESLARLVADAVKEHGCNLYHLEHKGRRLQIYVDKKGGATIGDCEEISRALSLGLAAASDEWRRLELDVSTPGIERKLYTPAHYRGAVGERLRVKIEGEVIEGRLKEIDEEGISVETEAGVGRRLTYNEILSAQVQRTTEELFKRR